MSDGIRSADLEFGLRQHSKSLVPLAGNFQVEIQEARPDGPGRKMGKGLGPGTGLSKCIPNCNAVRLDCVRAERDQPARLVREFTMGGNIGADYGTTDHEGLSEGKSETFGE